MARITDIYRQRTVVWFTVHRSSNPPCTDPPSPHSNLRAQCHRPPSTHARRPNTHFGRQLTAKPTAKITSIPTITTWTSNNYNYNHNIDTPKRNPSTRRTTRRNSRSLPPDSKRNPNVIAFHSSEWSDFDGRRSEMPRSGFARWTSAAN